jgi:hypothetical protein
VTIEDLGHFFKRETLGLRVEEEDKEEVAEIQDL